MATIDEILAESLTDEVAVPTQFLGAAETASARALLALPQDDSSLEAVECVAPAPWASLRGIGILLLGAFLAAAAVKTLGLHGQQDSPAGASADHVERYDAAMPPPVTRTLPVPAPQAASPAAAVAQAAAAPATHVSVKKPPGLRGAALGNSSSMPNTSAVNHSSDIWKNHSSVFCFMVVEPGNETEIAKWQFRKQTGIFECSNWAVYSDGPQDPIELGVGPDGKTAYTIPIPGPPAIMSTQSCLGCHTAKRYIMNANVLMRAWDKASKDGIAGEHSWIVKVDADSVLSAPRLMRQIQMHGKFDIPDLWPGRYLRNCQVLDSMQGSLEVLSRQAFYNFAANHWKCFQIMDWYHMGEDIFTFHCLRHLGIWSVHVDEMLHDYYCSYSGYPNCWQPDVAVFHPLKTLDGQGDCWWKMRQVDRGLAGKYLKK
mmetsp:Transcript_133929/g.317554  ORF Transcript_133929/g.317554 Transcript_133929/m.317554 type:complete len:429 (+) Transcript_133929:34-1320(+)